MKLSKHACIPCQGGVPSLSSGHIKTFLEKLHGGWTLNDQGHIEKTYHFKDFVNAMNFANFICKIAEKEGHHPDLFISWGKCRVEIWTHKVNGLTESDFYLAAKIEEIDMHSK